MLLFRRQAPVAALLLLVSGYTFFLSSWGVTSLGPTLVLPQPQDNSVAQAAQLPVAVVPAPGPARRSHRGFCNASAENEGPNRPLSQFTERTNAGLRAAAIAAGNADSAAKAELRAQLAPLAARAKCYWAKYLIPNYADPPELYPICTHDPRVDVSISAALHKSQAWFGSYIYQDLLGVMVNGSCPPDRPVMLDLGLNIGSFAMYGVQLGCHVIGFDGLSANVNRVVQTMVKAVGKDGKPFIERFHGYVNAVGNYVGDVTMAFNPANPGTSSVADKTWTVQANVAETVHAVIVDDLFEIPQGQRPQVRVGKQGTAGKWEYAMQALQREHVYFVKIDVETFEIVTIHGMRRLLEGTPRPAALFIEIALDQAQGLGCDAMEFARFMYDLGYVYVEGVGRTAEMEEAALLAGIQHKLACEGCGLSLEGWWLLRQ